MNYALLLACVLGGSAALGYAALVLALRLGSRRWAPEAVAGRTALVLRALPGSGALIAALGLALPAFLLHEPARTEAWPGATAAVLASAGALLLAASLRRGLAAWRATRRLVREWGAIADPLPGGGPLPAWTLDHPFPVVAVVGIVRPRLFLARSVAAALTPAEAAAVLAHEAGHVASRDNLKRLVLRFLPTAGWAPLAARLEQRWTAATEAEADRAAGPGAALDLAAALVKVARLAPPGALLEAPVAAFHSGGDGVAARVQALLAPPAVPAGRHRGWPLALALLALAALAGGRLLPYVHQLNETLVHLP